MTDPPTTSDATGSDAPPTGLAGRGGRWRFSLLDLLLTVTVVAVYLAAFAAICRGRSSRESAQLAGLAVAIFVGTFLGFLLVRRWVKRRAGPVVALLRLKTSRTGAFARACWLPLVVILLTSVVGRVPAWQQPQTGGTTWPSFVRGLLVLWMIQAACFAWVYVTRRSLAVCERGFVYQESFFVPWRKVRPGNWSLDEQGKLTGGRRGTRIVVHVPPEQRLAVEALLAEKMGEDSAAREKA